MNNVKRPFSEVANDIISNGEKELPLKKQKKNLSNNDMEIDVIEHQQKTIDKIRYILRKPYNLDIVDDVVELILQYNTSSLWYRNGTNQIEWFDEIEEEIKHIYNGSGNRLFVHTVNGDLWCKGWNYSFYFGLGHNKPVNEFILQKFFKDQSIKIKKIWVGSCAGHTFFQDTTNKLYGCGYNWNNQFGLGIEPRKIQSPELLQSIENIEQIGVGDGHSIILNNNGRVFGCKIHGDLYYGENGDGQNNFSLKDDKFYPIKFFDNIKIIQISVGAYHSLFLSDDGEVWSCGSNRHGQLGYDCTVTSYPQKINGLTGNSVKIKMCASGHSHSLLLNTAGIVYAFGRNYFGECGLNTNDRKIVLPTMIELDEKIDNIKCGARHSYMKSEKETHFLFGDNQRNQCGLKTVGGWKISKPMAINQIVEKTTTGALINIKEVCVGDHYTIINVSELDIKYQN